MKTIKTEKNDDMSKALYISKAFAVVSIVLAHTYYDSISNEFVKTFLSIYKLIGVYVFFIISGYFYNKDKYKNLWELLKDKLVKIGIPWLVFGTVNYIIPLLINEQMEFSVVGYINYLLGNGSFLYFLTMLIVCYIILYFLPRKQEVILIYLNIISVILTSINIFPQLVDNTRIVFTYLNPYLNILNWIGIFSIGVLIRRKNWLEKYENLLKDKWIFISLIYILIYTTLCLTKLDITYWNILSIIIGILSFIEILVISLKLTKCNMLIDIGKKSFFIYQIHIIFLILLGGAFETSTIFAILRPVIVILMIYILTIIGQRVAKWLKIDKLYSMLLGIR